MADGIDIQKRVIPKPGDILEKKKPIPSPSDVLSVKKKEGEFGPSSTQPFTSSQDPSQSGFRTSFEKGRETERAGNVSQGDIYKVEPEPDFDPRTFDYIMEQGAAGSLVAKGVMFLSMLDQGTKLKKDNPFQYASEQMQKMKAAREERFADYDPSIPENVAAGLFSLALDSGPFALAAKGSAATTKGLTKAARWTKAKLVGGGMAKEAAEAATKQAVAAKIAEGGIQTGLTLGQYSSAQNIIDQLSSSDIDDFDAHETLKAFGKEFLIGVPVGVLGAVGGMVGANVANKMLDKGVSNFVSKATGGAIEYGAFTPAEAGVFEAGGALLEDRKPTVDGWLSSIGIVLGAKVSGKMAKPRASENFRPEKADKGEFSIDLSVNELNKLSEREAKGMTKDEVIDRMMTDKDYRENVMNNPEIPWTTKAKLEWATNGIEPTEVPEVVTYDIVDSRDGRSSLQTRDANGALVQSVQFSNKIDALKASSEVDASLKEADAMSSVANMSVKSFSELDTKVKDVGIDKGLGSIELQDAISTPIKVRTPEQSKMVDSFMRVYNEYKVPNRSTEPLSQTKGTGAPQEGEKPNIDITDKKPTTKAMKNILSTSENAFTRELFQGENRVGEIVVDEFPDAWSVKWVEVDPSMMRKGVASDTYRKLNTEAEANGKVFRSDKVGKSNTKAKALWDKLVSSGEALKLDDGSYVMKNEHTETYLKDKGYEVEKEGLQEKGQQKEISRMGPETPKWWAAKTWNRFMKARGLMPKDVYQAWVKTQGALNAEMFEIEMTQKNFSNAMKEAYGKNFSKENLEEINDVLKNLGTGDEQAAMLQRLPEPVREVVADMRNQIDALSREMLRMGMIEGDLVGKFEENMGFYLTRRYKAHNDPEWVFENIPEEIKNRAFNFMRKEYPKLSEGQIEGELRSMLKDPDMPLGLLKAKKLGSKDLGILKLRKNIPVELRDFLGEYKDPLYNYASSVYRMADLIGREKFLRDVKDMGMGRFLFEEKTATHYRPIAAEGSKVMSPLNGLYTTPELAGAFERFNSSVPWTNWAMRMYARLNSAVKYGKTIAAPQTHIRNYESNFILQLANGRFFNTKGDVGDLFKFAYAKKGRNSPEYKEYIKRAIELGVLRDNARAGEIFDVIEDAHRSLNDFDKATETWVNKPLKKLNKLAQEAYQLEDDVHKLYAYGVELQRYESVFKKKYPNKSAQEIRTMTEERAADIVRNTTPTYSLVPVFLKNVRRFPVTGTFISFPAEIMRTTWNVADIAIREMKDPATREIGMTRMAGLLSAAGMTYGLKRAMWYMFGLTKEDDDDMRRFRPPWSEYSDALIVSDLDKGVYSEVDMAFSDPLNYIKNAVNAVTVNMDNPDEAWKEGLKELVSPFAEEELLFSNFIDVLRNTNKDTRSPIYNEDYLMGDKMKESLHYLWKNLQPGFLSSASRVAKGAKGVKEGGREYKLSEETTALILGLRISRRNTGQSFKYHVNDWRDRIDQTRFGYIKVLNSSNPSEAKLDRVYETTNEALKKIIMEAHEDYLAARRLGVPKKELAKHLNTINDKKLAGMIISGRYTPINKRVGKW